MKLLAAPLGLILALAQFSCGGGSSSPSTPKASGLVYTNPASGTYRLVRNADLSTTTHLVLDLVGPLSGTGSGVSVTLSAGTPVAWSNVNGSDPAGTFLANGTQFSLGSAPQILKARVTGQSLVGTVAEKGFSAPKSLNGTLLRVALDFRTGLGTLSGTDATLQVGTCRLLDASGTLQDITLTAGTLVCQ
ncbi:hypothetical protein [Holophaga foetida]|uniref:hypothetical protein n=1 Tax=Holophaga foetida TaxID=35839 RepID=UPI0002471C6F|nr:hypothetical protein [Holophaga foetida]